MNTPTLQESTDNPIVVALVSAVVGAIIAGGFSLYVTNYSAQISAQARMLEGQASEMREHDQAIIDLKASSRAQQNEEDRTAKAVNDMQGTLGQILGAIEHLKDATNEAKDEMQGTHKAIDSLNDIIRPARNPSVR